MATFLTWPLTFTPYNWHKRWSHFFCLLQNILQTDATRMNFPIYTVWKTCDGLFLPNPTEGRKHAQTMTNPLLKCQSYFTILTCVNTPLSHLFEVILNNLLWRATSRLCQLVVSSSRLKSYILYLFFLPFWHIGWMSRHLSKSGESFFFGSFGVRCEQTCQLVDDKEAR